MVKVKELKNKRSWVIQESREVRKKLKLLVGEAKAAAEKDRGKFLDKIESQNKCLSDLLAQVESISDEIISRRAKSKPKKKKVRKVHNVAGRYVDPTGFAGVVQGGSPGGGKRR